MEDILLLYEKVVLDYVFNKLIIIEKFIDCNSYEASLVIIILYGEMILIIKSPTFSIDVEMLKVI
ncbi:hypothetical protein [Candidatus Neoehrlichia procyonis]|uniref:Uncharacterized protein n=1 Tax=Candidatus Neoehrlichia procyonis str. RAC413 TaxID=1359163 RepID=A0A0F3NMN0_9RICK|nr:hypothetical protein [Candidatus Neoehrlichia lotoris]KJV69318.1 hypothetical protein NLO413_0705 [Candidatus Neoehrlichia lotoris str. RAC413]